VAYQRELVTLFGRVQGVGFRDRVREIATRHAVAGSVRNAGYDRVAIDVQGDEDAIDAFIDDVLRHQPRFAVVDRVERSKLEPNESSGFAVAPSERD